MLTFRLHVNMDEKRMFGGSERVGGERAEIPVRRAHLHIRYKNTTMRYSATICENSQRHCLLEFKMQSTFSAIFPDKFSAPMRVGEHFPYSICRFRRLLSIGGQTYGCKRLQSAFRVRRMSMF